MIGLIRKMLETAGFSFTDNDFKKVMKNATDDIKFNRIKFRKKTSINGVLVIAERCSELSERVEEKCEWM